MVVPTGSTRVRWLVHAPTMRVPMPPAGPLETAVHDAFWAALVAVDQHNRGAAPEDVITSLACPGFGTGFGRVAPARAASLMATAYRCWRAGASSPISSRERDLAP